MKKLILIILAAAILLFSGCVSKNGNGTEQVKIGDNVSIDYIGSINGTVFDTTIETIGKENNLSKKSYKPISFIVGKEKVIKGLDEGIIGMKVGETKTLIIPPEKAYGQKDPNLIQIVPIIQNISVTRTFPKIINIPIEQFNTVFGADHKIGDTVNIPESNITLTIQSITTSNVIVSYNLQVGEKVSKLAPWNETVIKIDENNITTKAEAKKNDVIHYPGAVWNSTIIDFNEKNITLMHNRIPDNTFRIRQIGVMRVHFNDTYITLDVNKEYAGDTLTFNVTVRSINNQ